jgi:CubicO group peptidase (beta-lactamase class C family)
MPGAARGKCPVRNRALAFPAARAMLPGVMERAVGRTRLSLLANAARGLAAALVAEALAGQKAPAGTVVDGEAGRALDAAVQALRPEFWGGVVASTGGRVLLSKGYGQQDHQRVPNGPGSLFDLGGISHLVTALAALQVQAQRKWSLDDPIGRLLPEVPTGKAAITLRQLVLHTSGLPPEASFAGGAGTGRRSALAAILAAALVDAPGRACHVSPLNGTLLAIALEHVTGEPFAEIVQRRVFAPAGARDSFLLDDRRLDEQRLTWRRADAASPGAPATAIGLDWSRRGGQGVLATPRDAHELMQALLGGRLAEGQLDLLLAPVAGGDVYRVRPVELGGVRFVELHGAVTGYRSRIVVHAASRSVLVVLGGEVELDPVVRALGELLAAGLPGPKTAATATPAAPAAAAAGQGPAEALRPDPDLDRFVGAFALANGGVFEVRRGGDGLVVTGLGLQASARLQAGCWPPAGREAELRGHEERGLAWFAAPGAPASAKVFASEEAAVAARAQWDALAPRLGKAPEWQYLGTEPGAPAASWFRTRGRDPVALRVVWRQDGRIQSFAETREPPPFRLAFKLVHKDLAAALLGKTLLSITIEGEGAGRVLVFEDGTPGQAGLCECAWCGEAR